MDVRIRNSEWESDGELQGKLSKYVTKGLQRNEILKVNLSSTLDLSSQVFLLQLSYL